MHLFNQNYHIQKHLRKLQIEKKKKKRGVQEKFYEKTISEYISFEILIIDF